MTMRLLVLVWWLEGTGFNDLRCGILRCQDHLWRQSGIVIVEPGYCTDSDGDVRVDCEYLVLLLTRYPANLKCSALGVLHASMG